MRPLSALLIAAGLTLAGCGLPSVGLHLEAPRLTRKWAPLGLHVTDVDSRAPAFRWEPLEDFLARAQKEDESYTAPAVADVSYELRVWYAAQGPEARLAYARDGLTRPEHVPETDLEPGQVYRWSVRAHFTVAGERRVTTWSMVGALREDEPVPNISCPRFRTPE